MTRREYALVDVFTDRKFGGNQLAVFGDGTGIGDESMQAAAKELNLPETTFVVPAERGGDHKLRIFTPARELPFAGHPTVGTAFVLAGSRDATLRLEEQVGTLEVTVRDGFTEMEQPLPTFEPVADRAAVAASISLDVADLEPGLPIEVGSSGNRFMFVAVKTLDAVKRASPRGLAEATYIFTTKTVEPASTVHGRMYAPWQGIAEDPATGSANGPLGAYLVRHGLSDGKGIVSEQGYEMGRPSLLYVRVGGGRDRITSVHVGGRCALAGGGWLDL
ncbi:MAG TPA: PhzF family phenazine biosynthesis protein [Candidatus Saccharimonadales bacterium]|jgi:trans-2,3-dihydro-3-hydroxyanthranilate isomerase|nr:PhzF family phenazine biosynthesis protein [Candidatus Saccharimonadales bacterium]